MGIGEGKSKSKSLNWKSNGIDLFIEEAMAESREVSELLQMLKQPEAQTPAGAAAAFEKIAPFFKACARQPASSPVRVQRSW